MGFFGALNQLLDENSDKSFEKIIVGAIDKVEGSLNQTLDKAEAGVKKVDEVGQKIDTVATNSVRKIDNAVKKADHVGRTLESSANKISEIVKKPEEDEL